MQAKINWDIPLFENDEIISEDTIVNIINNENEIFYNVETLDKKYKFLVYKDEITINSD